MKGKIGNEDEKEVQQGVQTDSDPADAGGKSAAEVARALEVHPSDLYRWRRELNEHGAQAFTGPGQKRADDDRVAQLERKVGQQTLEIDFLKRALQHVEEQRLLRALSNGAPSTSRSKKK